MSTLQYQFEQLLSDGPVDVFEFLSSNPNSSPGEQLAVALLDQKRSWQSAAPKWVEEYLRQLPHLAKLPHAVVALAAAEFEAQSNTETKPDIEEFTSRFLEVAEQLREEIEKQFATQSARINWNQQDILGDRYRLIRLLGEGAFGSVYLAFDSELEREVAVKVPTLERFQHSQDGDTYLSEARTVASLIHPNIVPVYDAGKTAQGAVFVVSRFIAGETLEARLMRSRPTYQETASLLKTIAEALSYAHDRRLIHRDVKPANILIEAATNTAFITDFGLAIREEDYTKHLGLAGTLAYMSPEQARGEGHRLDGRSDVFALGVVLYEMLTGQRPFRGSTQNEILHQVISVEPRTPRSLRPEIPAELERICHKALSKPLSDRYAKATALAEDLDAWIHPKFSSFLQPTEYERITPKGLRSFDAGDASFFLDLLPGLRNRHGLPESIDFWKQRIELTDSEKTFSVGLIYGPSGCGKSSLVKAGLLPHLDPSIIAVVVEATPEETELRVLRALRKRLADLPQEATLLETLKTIRRTPGNKVVVILDQFEQWLYSHEIERENELVIAMRQCDGGRLQAIVVVRDDFAMAASRFMRALDTRIIEGHNFATVDLFDIQHASKVLTKLGQAYGKLPANATQLDSAQQQFVTDTATGLAQDGMVVSVRLALFAEMVKNKPWTVDTLRAVGGTEGIGVNFLEETFGSRNANPDHRRHALAARGVLKSLMPEFGTDIKGHMRSHTELLEATEYMDRLNEFNELLRILDGELRLITPTDPEGHGSQSKSDSHAQYFQLTHDYLVPSLREWLTRKQRETRKGRAELKLAERASAWASIRESKQLPTIWEWLSIRCLTSSNSWTELQSTIMHKSDRRHGAFMGILLAFLLATGIAMQQYVAFQNRERERDFARILTTIDSVQMNKGDSIPVVLSKLDSLPRMTVLNELRARIVQAQGQQKLALAYALARYGQVEIDTLIAGIVNENVPGEEVANIVSALEPKGVLALEEIRSAAMSTSVDPKWIWKRKTRLAIVATYLKDPSIAAEMLRVNPATLLTNEQRNQQVLSSVELSKAENWDPVQRTEFIAEFPRWCGEIRRLAKILEETKDSAMRSGFSLALGGVNRPDDQSKEDWRRVLEKWYVNESDSSTHSATGWAIRRLDSEPPAMEPTHRPTTDRQWWNTPMKLTMVKIPAGVVGGKVGPVHNKKSFWLANQEISIELYQQFMVECDVIPNDWQGVERFENRIDETHPVQNVSWEDSLMFCNWLSHKHGLVCCYEMEKLANPVTKNGKITQKYNVTIIQSNGFRLPTQNEWEYACRAGTSTNFSCGNDTQWLEMYAVYSTSTTFMTNPCGSKLCNDWGLFDLNGNVIEWCEDSSKVEKIRMGGGWVNGLIYMGSSSKYAEPPAYRDKNGGFRVACGPLEKDGSMETK